MNSADLAGKAGNETHKEIAAERRDTDNYKEDGTQDKHHWNSPGGHVDICSLHSNNLYFLLDQIFKYISLSSLT